MDLLKDIQNSCIDQNTNLPTLLRKCRILAERLNHNEFKAWVQAELDGYTGPVPEYRSIQAESYGHFSGPFGSGLRNAPIPLLSIPEDYRKYLFQVDIRDGVSVISNLASTKQSTINLGWPADLIALVQRSIYQNMALNQAWRSVPVSFLIGILDTVRNRILNFALEIEKDFPSAGEHSLPNSSDNNEKVTSVYHNTIMGNVTNLSQGSSDFNQISVQTITKGNLDALVNYLNSLSVAEEDITELKEAIKNEKVTSGGFGKKVAGWIGKMVQKAAGGVWKIGIDVASGVLAKALSQFYGLPS